MNEEIRGTQSSPGSGRVVHLAVGLVGVLLCMYAINLWPGTPYGYFSVLPIGVVAYVGADTRGRVILGGAIGSASSALLGYVAVLDKSITDLKFWGGMIMLSAFGAAVGTCTHALFLRVSIVHAVLLIASSAVLVAILING